MKADDFARGQAAVAAAYDVILLVIGEVQLDVQRQMVPVGCQLDTHHVEPMPVLMDKRIDRGIPLGYCREVSPPFAPLRQFLLAHLRYFLLALAHLRQLLLAHLRQSLPAHLH